VDAFRKLKVWGKAHSLVLIKNILCGIGGRGGENKKGGRFSCPLFRGVCKGY